MARIPEDKLRQVLDRFEDIEARMNAAAGGDTIVRLSREHAALAPVAEGVRRLRDARAELADLHMLMETEAGDMAALAEEEARTLEARLDALEGEVQLLLLPRDEDDDASIMLEIRAGTGGDEAALFAGDLFRMYQRYAATRGWSVDVIDESPGEVGGFKEVVARVTGAGVFGEMKFESGVHRVQRVPATESGGRIHTSAATVAVLPEPEDVAIEVRNEDIRVDTMRASGAGGQHVNTTDSAVRITHIPTGIVVTSSEKSQHQNRAIALQALKVKLYDRERARKDAERAGARKAQVGSGDRSERIRTYNFPQGRVTDHRINLTLHALPTIIEGDIGELVTALQTEDQAARLAAFRDDG